MRERGSKALCPVYLTVCPLADLFETAVVSNRSGCEGVSMDGVVANGGWSRLEEVEAEFGAVIFIIRVLATEVDGGQYGVDGDGIFAGGECVRGCIVAVIIG